MENLVRCPNGHFYDSREFRTCPYCNQHTVAGTMPVTPVDSLKTTPMKPTSPEKPQADDIGKTIGAYAEIGETAPVTGWLVCIEGTQTGKDFRLCAGRNYIGRNAEMDVCLADDPRVSRNRHAIIIFDPASQTTFCQAGESRELFYHNGKVVTDTQEIHQGDTLQIGGSKLVFVPFCGTIHNWEP